MRRTTLFLIGSTAGFALLRARHAREERLTERIAAAALETLLRAIDANDRDTGDHVRRVAAYALTLARAAGLDDRQRRAVERVALFHDIGKIHAALFDIVHDDESLSPEERALIATHPQRGADVLAPLRAFYPELDDGVRSHHERWDGTGYPRGLRGTTIPLTARLVAIADTFDVITHGRRYSRARRLSDAQRALEEGRAAQFEPALVDLFLSPPVLEEAIEQGEAAVPRRRKRPELDRRQRAVATADAPDITFRWRSESLAPRPRARARRTPRG